MADASIKISAVDNTRQAFDSVKRNLGDLERAGNSARNVLAGIGVGLSASAFVGFVRSSIDAADNLAKLSQRVGVTVESLSELQYAGKLSDVSLEGLGDSLRKLSVNLQEGAKGSKEYVNAFKAVGVSTNELLSIKPDEALRRIADAFAGMEDGAGKTALAVKLLGRSGADLIPLLNGGAAGLRQAGDEAKRFGLIVSTDAAKAAEQFNDNMTRLGTATEAFGIKMANVALPNLSAFVEQLLEGQRIFGGFASALFNIGVAIDPFKSLGENLKSTRSELNSLLQSLKNTPLENTRTRALIEGQIDTLQKRLEFLKFQERQAIASRGSAGLDARDLRLQQGNGKSGAPDLTDRTAAIAKAVAERQRLFEKQYQDELAANKALSDEEIRNLERVADAEQRLRDERAADLEKRLQEGPDIAAQQQAAIRSQIDAIISGTPTAQIEELRTQVEALNDRYLQGAVSLEKYTEARRTLDQQIADVANVSRDAFPEMADEGEKAFERLQYAVEGWGRAASQEFARFIVDGEGQLDSFVKKILSDIVQIQIQRSVVDPLVKAGTLALGGVFSGTTTTGSELSGYAAGGPVTGGSPIIVGEKGPEIFVPGSSGNIVPNGRIGSSVVINNYIDSRTDIASIAAISRATERRVYDQLARR